MTDKKNSLTYAEAGVDIDAGNALVRAIAPPAAGASQLTQLSTY